MSAIGPEHIHGRGALPPRRRRSAIEGEYYWDGGIVSNTPLQYLLDQEEDRSSLVFQVDLFSARGVLPRSMPDVLSRHKDIMYSSRTRPNTDNFRAHPPSQAELLGALKRVPADRLTKDEQALIEDYSNAGVVNIVHLIYQHKNYEGHATDYEFSGTRCASTGRPAWKTPSAPCATPKWLVPPVNQEAGVAVHDLHREDPT